MILEIRYNETILTNLIKDTSLSDVEFIGTNELNIVKTKRANTTIYTISSKDSNLAYVDIKVPKTAKVVLVLDMN